MGTLIAHQDKPLYSFFNADRICDFLLSIGMRPFVEFGFMPEMLASGPEPVFHYRGNIMPPKDYDVWSTLIRKLVGHWVERYGLAEVRQWFFEVWNEPNLPAFWTGTQEDYFRLYAHTPGTQSLQQHRREHDVAVLVAFGSTQRPHSPHKPRVAHTRSHHIATRGVCCCNSSRSG